MAAGRDPGAPVPVPSPIVGPAELTLAGLARLGPGSVCDEEPIHLSGSIQPHGFLLGVEPDTLEVRVASTNLAALTGVDVDRALAARLDAVIGPVPTRCVSPLASAEPGVRFDPVAVHLDHRGGCRGGEFDVVAHRSGALTLLEFEPVAGAGTGSTRFQHLLRSALDPDLSAVDVRELCAATAGTVRQLTGFDRVLVYKFDDDAHGVVVAESTGEAGPLRPLLGLHYPAGDIPRQARSLFLTKRIRAIPDVGYDPVPLRGQPGVVAADSVDLTNSDLRSVSPVHLQYLRRMGIAASLTLSLVCGDTLWGMVLCHHDTPRYVPARVRALCETLAHTLSLQLQVRRSLVGRERAAARARTVAEVVSALGESRAADATLASLTDSLVELVPADAVLLHLDGRTASSGGGLGADVRALVRLVQTATTGPGADSGSWSTDRLPEDAAAAELGAVAGRVRGVLGVPVGSGGDVVVWLRQETVAQVEWAGPALPPPAQPSPAQPSPRGERSHVHDRSGSTRQLVHGRSAPWTPEDREAVATLLDALPQAVLRRASRRFSERDAGSRAALAASTEKQHQLERDLQRKLRLEALGKMAGGVAHDFNNLLAVILNHAESIDDLTRREVPLTGAQLRQLSDDSAEVVATAQRAARLTRQLLSFARREVTQPRVVSVNQVVAGLAELLDRSVGGHVRLETVLCAEQPTVLADPDQLERALVNLAVNARDAMPTGGTVTISTSVEDRPGPARVDGAPVRPCRWVRLRVADTGSGIRRDVLDKVFDPFFTTKTDGEGSGLGLSTVHTVVDQAGGQVQVESEVGVGTTVDVLLPLSALDLPVPPAAAPARAAPPARQTVLLVDDEPALREGIRRVLTGAGYEVLDAEGGAEAIALADAHPGPVHVLLTDVVMPGVLGRQVADHLRATRPGVRVLYMSGFALAATNGTGQLEPGDALIDKPFLRSDLLTRLSELHAPDRPVPTR